MAVAALDQPDDPAEEQQELSDRDSKQKECRQADVASHDDSPEDDQYARKRQPANPLVRPILGRLLQFGIRPEHVLEIAIVDGITVIYHESLRVYVVGLPTKK